MTAQHRALRGGEVLPALAELYPQLFLLPGEEGQAAYREIVQSGADAPSRSLAHFLGHGEDSCIDEETPAGIVPVITLHQRADFELFLQIMAFRCTPTAIKKTQGAAILDGVVTWSRIRAHKRAFLEGGGDEATWDEEFRRFTADKTNYKDTLILLSSGPYSAVPAERAGYPEEEWLSLSHEIRKAHECTHFICRRLFPDRKDAVWDELVADAVGIYAALGRYDLPLAERFLGIEEGRYTGGRLENYLDGDENRQERLDALAEKIHKTLCRFEALVAQERPAEPYALAIRLEEEIECWKQL